MLEIQQNAT